jgi:hypothetical protein
MKATAASGRVMKTMAASRHGVRTGNEDDGRVRTGHETKVASGRSVRTSNEDDGSVRTRRDRDATGPPSGG